MNKLMKFFIFFIVLSITMAQTLSANEINPYRDKINHLENLNNILKNRLITADEEIKKLHEENEKLKDYDFDLAELEKTKKDLAKKEFEIKKLREKMMTSVDESITAENK